MPSIVREYLLLLDILEQGHLQDPHFMRTEQFDKLNDRMAKLWHYMTETEMKYIEERLKEKGPRHVVITRADLGLPTKT
jgi:uncharacterized protein YdcH (DUF465 family)